MLVRYDQRANSGLTQHGIFMFCCIITVLLMYLILLASLKFCHNRYQKKKRNKNRKRIDASAEEHNSSKNVWKFPLIFLFSKKNKKKHPAVSWDRNNCHRLIANCPATSNIVSAKRCIYLFTVSEPAGLPRNLFNSAGTGQLQRPWSAEVSRVLTGIPFQVRHSHTLHIPQQEEFCNRKVKYKKLYWEQAKKKPLMSISCSY